MQPCARCARLLCQTRMRSKSHCAMVYFPNMAHRFSALLAAALMSAVALTGCTQSPEATHSHDPSTPMYAQLCENTFTHTRARDEFCAINDASHGEVHNQPSDADASLDSPYAAIWVRIDTHTPDTLPAISEPVNTAQYDNTRTPPTGDVHIITIAPDGTYELEP